MDKQLTEDQIKDIMSDVLHFYKCLKHLEFRGASETAMQVAKNLKVLGFTPLGFKKTCEKLGGQPMPDDDKFYLALSQQFKEIE